MKTDHLHPRAGTQVHVASLITDMVGHRRTDLRMGQCLSKPPTPDIALPSQVFVGSAKGRVNIAPIKEWAVLEQALKCVVPHSPALAGVRGICKGPC